MTVTLDNLDTQAIHDAFCAWQTDEASLDAQLVESLAALEAYQSHLDGWHKELAQQREALQKLEAKLDHDRAKLESAIADQQNAGRATSNTAALEEANKQIAALTDELRVRLDELQRLKHARAEVVEKPAPEPAAQVPSHSRTASPVLGSIVEQFGKLRQQRAVDRQAAKKQGN